MDVMEVGRIVKRVRDQVWIRTDRGRRMHLQLTNRPAWMRQGVTMAFILTDGPLTTLAVVATRGKV